jgi:DNA-binding transcriptional MerR regulator
MKRYNISQLAKELGVARQTLYYWIEKGWIKPKRDYRNYPVFTEVDFKKIKKWMNQLNEG